MADKTSSALDNLFDDLNFELELTPPAPVVQAPALPAARVATPVLFDRSYAELAVAALDRLTPAAVMLTENDPVASVPTRPYDVPVEELFGDADSSLLTVPVYLGELPEEAYPTELTLPAIW